MFMLCCIAHVAVVLYNSAACLFFAPSSGTLWRQHVRDAWFRCHHHAVAAAAAAAAAAGDEILHATQGLLMVSIIRCYDLSDSSKQSSYVAVSGAPRSIFVYV
jgi:hypothetical protein